MNLSRSSGVQLHPTSLPSGRLGPEAYAWVDWLAEAGQTWWQMLPLGPPDRTARRTRRRRRSPPRRGCWPSPRAPVSRAGGAGLPRARAPTGSRTGSPTAGAARSTTRCASTASGPRCARYAAERGVRLIGDIPIYVAAGLGRPAGASGAVHRRRRGRRAAGRVHRQGPAVGQPAVRLAGDAARRATRWWIARFRRVFELFDLARIDHFRGFVRLLGGAGGRRVRAARARWRRGPGRAPFDAATRGAGRRCR